MDILGEDEPDSCSKVQQAMGTDVYDSDSSSSIVPAVNNKLQHPHFGGKQPKKHTLQKCISIVWKEEREHMRNELKKAKEELASAKDKIRKFIYTLQLLSDVL